MQCCMSRSIDTEIEIKRIFLKLCIICLYILKPYCFLTIRHLKTCRRAVGFSNYAAVTIILVLLRNSLLMMPFQLWCQIDSKYCTADRIALLENLMFGLGNRVFEFIIDLGRWLPSWLRLGVKLEIEVNQGR